MLSSLHHFLSTCESHDETQWHRYNTVITPSSLSSLSSLPYHWDCIMIIVVLPVDSVWACVGTLISNVTRSQPSLFASTVVSDSGVLIHYPFFRVTGVFLAVIPSCDAFRGSEQQHVRSSDRFTVILQMQHQQNVPLSLKGSLVLLHMADLRPTKYMSTTGAHIAMCDATASAPGQLTE